MSDDKPSSFFIKRMTGKQHQKSSLMEFQANKRIKWLLAILWFQPILLVSFQIHTSQAGRVHLRSRRDAVQSGSETGLSGPREVGSIVFPYLKPKYYPIVEQYYYPNESSYENSTVNELIHDSVIAKVFTLFLGDVNFHRYADPNQLKQSGGPEVDQELCLKQLSQLNERTHAMKEERLDSKDIELNRLLDTFGRVPAGLSSGHLSWLGSYDDCLALKVRFREGKSAMRYCSVGIKLNGWPEDEDLDKVAVLKMGVCLPKACDSQQYKNKLELVQQLAELNGRQLDIGTWNFTYLYCLPDEESDLRIWWKSPGAVVTVVLLFGWISMLVFATIQHHKLVSAGKRRGDTIRADDNESLTAIKSAAHKLEFVGSDSQEKSKCHEIYRALSIYENFRALVRTTNAASQSADKKTFSVVDLSVLDGIKVICMLFVIVGHAVVFSFIAMDDLLKFAKSSLIISTLPTGPAFTVNMFFAITGLLTTYSAFKKQSKARIVSMVRPPNWFAFVLYRYLRLMPIYMVVVVYAKYIAVYTGSGPLWDYGTSTESQRWFCQRNSLLWAATLSTNVSGILETCVFAGWYLCADFHFALVTPILLACLAKNETLGRWLIKLCLLASFVATMFAQYHSPAPDSRVSVQAMPHYFKSGLFFNTIVYTQSQHRIGSYLVGLLLGLALHKYESKKLDWHAKQIERSRPNAHDVDVDGAQVTLETAGSDQNSLEPEWSRNFIRFYPIFCLTVTLFLAFVAPSLGPHLKISKEQGRVIDSLLVPTFNVLHAYLFGLCMLLASTGHGFKPLDRLLARPIWRPLSRLSLCALLANVLIVEYIPSISNHLRHFDTLFQMMIITFTVFITYFVSALLFVLFQAPFNGLTKQLLAPLLSSSTNNQSPKKPTSPSSS